MHANVIKNENCGVLDLCEISVHDWIYVKLVDMT